MTTVSLLSSDGVVVEASLAAARLSGAIAGALDGLAHEARGRVPVPRVTGDVLRAVVRHLEAEAAASTTEAAASATEAAPHVHSSLARLESKAELFELAGAANFLAAEGLLDACCREIAARVKGMAPPEIREYMGLGGQAAASPAAVPDVQFLYY